VADRCKRCRSCIPRSRRKQNDFCARCDGLLAKEAALLAIGLAVQSESYEKFNQEMDDWFTEMGVPGHAQVTMAKV
jgi:hypothetical protein